MIPNQWYAVLESSEIRPGKPVGVTRMGEKLVFWRDEHGKVSCLRDFCPHRGVALSQGRILDGTLECPFHGFRFDPSGACMLVPSNGKHAPLPRQIKAFNYPTCEEQDFVFIWWGEQPPLDLKPPRFFDDLGGLTYASAQDLWNAHYSRAIENQLDVAHVPFIHYNTIGRGGRALVDGPLVEWIDPDRFKLYSFNRLDDGTRPLKPEELTRPEAPFHLDFIFPNLWQNYISPNMRIVVAFVPIDHEHTMMYLRSYQNFMNLPVLRELVNWLSLPLNIYILHQDRRVVVTQVPKPSSLKMGEKLVQADRPIILYRQRRQELIDAASSHFSE